MNTLTKKGSPNGDIRSFLKNQHRKVYAACRLFASTYREQQELFSNMIAAASHSIMGSKTEKDRNILLLRACMNMAALHSISHSLQGVSNKDIQFKSPDFQNTMTRFRGAVGEISDYSKLRLYLQLEGINPDQFNRLTGQPTIERKPSLSWSWSGKNFIPYLKQIMVWN